MSSFLSSVICHLKLEINILYIQLHILYIWYMWHVHLAICSLWIFIATSCYMYRYNQSILAEQQRAIKPNCWNVTNKNSIIIWSSNKKYVPSYCYMYLRLCSTLQCYVFFERVVIGHQVILCVHLVHDMCLCHCRCLCRGCTVV